jgi:hypothetical protein
LTTGVNEALNNRGLPGLFCIRQLRISFKLYL